MKSGSNGAMSSKNHTRVCGVQSLGRGIFSGSMGGLGNEQDFNMILFEGQKKESIAVDIFKSGRMQVLERVCMHFLHARHWA